MPSMDFCFLTNGGLTSDVLDREPSSEASPCILEVGVHGSFIVIGAPSSLRSDVGRCAGRPRWAVPRFTELGKHCGFLEIEGRWRPSVERVSWCRFFPAAFAGFVSLCHILIVIARL